MAYRREVTVDANGRSICNLINEEPKQPRIFLRRSSVGRYVFVDDEGYPVSSIAPDDLGRAAALLNEVAWDTQAKLAA